MFEIGWTELLVIAVVAIVVVGPKDLPRALRTVGQWTARMKRMAREFQGQFNEALREAELDGVRKDVESIGSDLRSEMSKAGDSIKKSMDVTAAPSTGAPAADMQTPPAVAKPPSQLEMASSVMMTTAPPPEAPVAEPIPVPETAVEVKP